MPTWDKQLHAASVHVTALLSEGRITCLKAVKDKRTVHDTLMEFEPVLRPGQHSLHPSEVAKSSTNFGWGEGGNVTSAGWQVTLCDPIMA